MKRILHTTGLLENKVWFVDKWISVEEYRKVKFKSLHHNSGTLTVRNKKTGKTLKVNIGFDPLVYEPIKVGWVNVYDKTNNTWGSVTKEEFTSNRDKYKSYNEGLVTVYEISSENVIQVTSEEYKNGKNILYRHPTTGNRMTCPHCKKIVGTKRWHFNNCKERR